MKRIYEHPAAFIESFAANEYVAACYYLACQVGPGAENASNGSKWNGVEKGGATHAKLGTAGTCADQSANRLITDSGELLSGSKVGEYNKEQGWLQGYIDHWDDNNHNNKVDAGDYLYWHTVNTSNNNDRRWNHWGELKLVDGGKPNHS